MGKQKLFRVQAMNEKGMMLDVEIMGRKAHGIAMQEALGMCQAQGKGLIRSQMDGARGWAVYVIDAANDDDDLLAALIEVSEGRDDMMDVVEAMRAEVEANKGA